MKISSIRESVLFGGVIGIVVAVVGRYPRTTAVAVLVFLAWEYRAHERID